MAPSLHQRSAALVVWLIGLIVGLVGIGFALKRASSARTIDAGEVSESWLKQQRAEKQERP